MNPLSVGGNVTLTLNPPTNIDIGNWLLNGNTLVIFYPNGFDVNNTYKERLSFNQSTKQVSLSSLQVNDSGLYKLQGLNPPLTAELILSVQGEFSITNSQKHSTYCDSYSICYRKKENWRSRGNLISQSKQMPCPRKKKEKLAFDVNLQVNGLI